MAVPVRRAIPAYYRPPKRVQNVYPSDLQNNILSQVKGSPVSHTKRRSHVALPSGMRFIPQINALLSVFQGWPYLTTRPRHVTDQPLILSAHNTVIFPVLMPCPRTIHTYGGSSRRPVMTLKSSKSIFDASKHSCLNG
jgi:hypothetical protein